MEKTIPCSDREFFEKTSITAKEVLALPNMPAKIEHYKVLYTLKEDGTYRNDEDELLPSYIVEGVVKWKKKLQQIKDMPLKPETIVSNGVTYTLSEDGSYKHGDTHLDIARVHEFLQQGVANTVNTNFDTFHSGGGGEYGGGGASGDFSSGDGGSSGGD